MDYRSKRLYFRDLKEEEKVGMTKEGELRKVRFKNGMWVNEYIYGILAEEWESTFRNNA